jgi:5'-nucleotidase/UDP-sugar diphosphatase
MLDDLRRSNYANGEYIAFSNTGGIRAGLGKGPIDSAMVLAVVPFGNQARFVAVNGTMLKLMLENGLSDLNPNGGNGRFPAVHGIEFEYDPARPAGSRITTVMVRRRAFTPG